MNLTGYPYYHPPNGDNLGRATDEPERILPGEQPPTVLPGFQVVEEQLPGAGQSAQEQLGPPEPAPAPVAPPETEPGAPLRGAARNLPTLIGIGVGAFLLWRWLR